MKQITLYHPRVKQLAWKLYNTIIGHNSSISVNDLYHEGLIALYKCEKRFEEDRNVQFWTYAKQRVEGAIRDYIRKLPMISVPQKPMQKLKMYKQEQKKFQKDFSRVPSHSEMAKQLKMSVEELHQILQLEISYAETDDFIIGHYECHDQIQSSLIQDLIECINNLSDDEKIIINMHMVYELSLKELQKSLKFSKNTITKKKMQALEKLKKCLESQEWSIDDFK